MVIMMLCSDGDAEDGEDHVDVVRARISMVSRESTMPKGKAWETSTASWVHTMPMA